MTTQRIALSPLNVVAAVFALFISGTSVAEEPWALAKDSDGIKVYVRTAADSSLREFRGEIDLSTSPARIVKTLKDASSFRNWMPDVIASSLLKASDNEQYHYLENDAPWPVSHRDGIYHFTYTHGDNASANVTLVRVEAAPNYQPAREGKVRVPKAEGYWELTPREGGVHVVYQMHADPGGSLPTWLANQAAVDTPFRTLKGLRTYLQEAGQQPD